MRKSSKACWLAAIDGYNRELMLKIIRRVVSLLTSADFNGTVDRLGVDSESASNINPTRLIC